MPFTFQNESLPATRIFLFLIVLVLCGFGLSIYINSGFYSVLNDINECDELLFLVY